jgi:TRAP-type C4-dicarboxylate transport system substrate-binding protein
MRKQVAVLLMTAVLVAALAATGQAAPVTLTFANQNPDTSWSGINAIAPWAKQVEEATKGQVKVQIFWSQTLAKGKDNWEATKSGIADMAWCFHGYWPDMTPLADVISLPALPFTTAEQGSETLWKLYEKHPEIQKEFADNKVLLLFTSHPYILITTNKQVKTMEDMKGLKIRMTGGPPTEMMNALGGVPSLIPMPEMFLSMQRGIVDGMGAPWEAIHGFRFYEVVKYYTETPFPAVYFSIAMNQKKWDSLPKDVQDGILSVSGLKGSKFWGRNHFDTAKEGVLEKAKAEKREVNIYTLPDAERQRWVDSAGKPLWQKWVKDQEAAGRPAAQKILDSTLEMLGAKK